MGADEYRITEYVRIFLPWLIWGQTNTVLRNKCALFTLVDMAADEYRITEYVNKYEFNKSSIYLTILQFLLDYMKI